jgi:hypothetical protein
MLKKEMELFDHKLNKEFKSFGKIIRFTPTKEFSGISIVFKSKNSFSIILFNFVVSQIVIP